MKSTIGLSTLLIVFAMLTSATAATAPLRVGAAAIEIEADDSMVIAGGIQPGRAQGHEGKLRATALVIERSGSAPIAIVSCDVLFVTRDLVDSALAEIEKATGIPAANVMVHATHTHHAPSTARVHGYGPCDLFVERLRKGIVEAVVDAKSRLADTTFHFRMGQEATVGMNSRLRLKDGAIYWTGPRDDAVGPSGPMDPDLPVLAFRSPSGKMQALLFGHSTHSIGTLRPGVRSPSFYGMVAQDLESETGGVVAFLEGASGSTHRLDCSAQEGFQRIREAVLATIEEAQPQKVSTLAAIKRPFQFKIRTFDEATEDRAVSEYCQKRAPASAEEIVSVFRQMRRELAPLQGQKRTTWLQAMAIGEVAVVGVPAELFTKFGLDIKHRSPFPHTVVAELANDWIGYLPDREAHKLGGYQSWTGLHSCAEVGTGERMADEAVRILEELHSARP